MTMNDMKYTVFSTNWQLGMLKYNWVYWQWADFTNQNIPTRNALFQRRITDCSRVFQINNYVNLTCYDIFYNIFLHRASFIQIKFRWALFVTYTIIQFNPSKCTHTWSSGQPTLRLGVRCLAQGSHLSRGHFLPEPGFEPTTLGYLGFQVQRSIH